MQCGCDREARMESFLLFQIYRSSLTKVSVKCRDISCASAQMGNIGSLRFRKLVELKCRCTWGPFQRAKILPESAG